MILLSQLVPRIVLLSQLVLRMVLLSTGSKDDLALALSKDTALLAQPGPVNDLALTTGSTDDQIALTADSMDGLAIMTVSIDDLAVTTGHNWLVLLLCYLIPRESCSCAT